MVTITITLPDGTEIIANGLKETNAIIIKKACESFHNQTQTSYALGIPSGKNQKLLRCLRKHNLNWVSIKNKMFEGDGK